MTKNTKSFAEIVKALTDLSNTQFKAAIRCAKQQRRATKMLETELIRQKRAKLPTKSTAKAANKTAKTASINRVFRR